MPLQFQKKKYLGYTFWMIGLKLLIMDIDEFMTKSMVIGSVLFWTNDKSFWII